jgi:hypothetical protein
VNFDFSAFFILVKQKPSHQVRKNKLQPSYQAIKHKKIPSFNSQAIPSTSTSKSKMASHKQVGFVLKSGQRKCDWAWQSKTSACVEGCKAAD